MLKAMMREAQAFASVLLAILALVVLAWLGTGCDESDAPAVHGVIRVEASPLPPFEVQFRDGSPSPTPVEVAP